MPYDNESGGCAVCAQRQRRRQITTTILDRVTRAWLRLLVRCAVGGAIIALGLGIFALWRLLAESGTTTCLLLTTLDSDGNPIPVYHHGWGYGWAAVWFGLVAWTVGSIVWQVMKAARERT